MFRITSIYVYDISDLFCKRETLYASPKFGVAIGGLKAAIGPGALKPTKVRI